MKMEKICEYCKEKFISQRKDARFCSKKCCDKYYYINVRRPKEIIGQKTKLCKYCGNPFITLPKHPYQIYCSQYCAHKAQIEKNPTKFKKYRKVYYQKNSKEARIKAREWRLNNPKRYKNFMVNYYEKNRRKMIERSLIRYEKFKELENKRREKLGLPRIGEGFKSEMELLVYVHTLFQNYEILTHHRKTLGGWGLQGLELDIYIPKLKLAFEYMGKQHYDKETYYLLTSYNNVKEDFEYQQYKDRCKKKICKMKGITLIRIRYDEKLSEKFLLSKLKYLPIKTNQEILKCV